MTDIFKLMTESPVFTIFLFIVLLGGLSEIVDNLRGKR